jgi:hypothetical protein
MLARRQDSVQQGAKGTMRPITDVIDFGDATESIWTAPAASTRSATTRSASSSTSTRSWTARFSASSSCDAAGIAPRGWPTRK